MLSREMARSVLAKSSRCRFLTLASTRYYSQKVCIVGSGPAGFYAAQHIIKTLPDARVDIYERLPVPFGLVRFGVAPDHPEVKNVMNAFTKTAQTPGVRFVGNVCVGADVTLAELRHAYNAVLLTYGAEEDRELGISGERLANVISARRVVGWYNGLPCDADLDLSLDMDTVAILGQGNVALDVARILLTPVDQLRHTDITRHALATLAESRVERVLLIGRRGPLQVSFTIKELREMVNLPGCGTVVSSADFAGIPEVIPDLPRSRKRLIELLCKTALNPRLDPNAEKVFQPIFLRSPTAILPAGDADHLASGIRLAVNRMEQDAAVPTGQEETVNCGLVLRSIGYRSIPIVGDVPFDKQKGLIPNQDGLVASGLYASGWVATGPVGVILSTMSNAFSVARTIVHDLSQVRDTKPGYDYCRGLLEERGVETVAWDGWERIDREERERGSGAGKPREKIVDVAEMLRVARS